MSGKKLGLDNLYKNLYTTVDKNSPVNLSGKGLPTNTNLSNRPTINTNKVSGVVKNVTKSVFRRSPIGRIADFTIKVGSGIGMGYEIAKNKFKTDKKSTGGETKLSPKQQKIAAAAPPPNKITGADFAALKKNKNVKKA